VVAASPAFQELVRSRVVSFPQPSAYRFHDGNWFALLARSSCPDIPDPVLDESTPTARQSLVSTSSSARTMGSSRR
jgi:hypothetical protein